VTVARLAIPLAACQLLLVGPLVNLPASSAALALLVVRRYATECHANPSLWTEADKTQKLIATATSLDGSKN